MDKKKGGLLIVSCHINRLENVGFMTVLNNRTHISKFGYKFTKHIFY